MVWGPLRSDLLTVLGCPDALTLSAEIGYPDAVHVTAALQGDEPPSDGLMISLLKHYITTPALYFVDPDAVQPAA